MKKQFANTREEVISILLSRDYKIDIEDTIDALFLVAIDKALCAHNFIDVLGPNGHWAIGYDELEIPPWISENELTHDTVGR